MSCNSGMHYYTHCIKVRECAVSWLIGVDVGGTFTDFFVYNARSNAIRLFKTPSTPDNPAAAIVDGVVESC